MNIKIKMGESAKKWFWVNCPTIFERTVTFEKLSELSPEESSREELVFERTLPQPDLLTQIFRLSFNVESLDTEAPEHTNNLIINGNDWNTQ